MFPEKAKKEVMRTRSFWARDGIPAFNCDFDSPNFKEKEERVGGRGEKEGINLGWDC